MPFKFSVYVRNMAQYRRVQSYRVWQLLLLMLHLMRRPIMLNGYIFTVYSILTVLKRFAFFLGGVTNTPQIISD